MFFGADPSFTIEISNIRYGNHVYPHTFEFRTNRTVGEELTVVIHTLGLPGHVDDYELVIHNSEGTTCLDNGKRVDYFRLALMNIMCIELRMVDPHLAGAGIEKNLHRVHQRRNSPN